MGKQRSRQLQDGRGTSNRSYRQEIGEKQQYISDKHKQQREEFLKNNPIVPMNPKQRKYMELLDTKRCILATYRDWETDRKSTRLNSSHSAKSRMPSSA